jgi:hypothetical protein|tara:strand:- start:46 stop:375 length:330 start_codon:yes stop_codon:yes gene_type:complete
MANTYKILGQSNPAATTDTPVYTVGSGKQAIVSSITLANLSGSAITYRVRVAADGAAVDDKQYLAKDSSLPANDSVILTVGVTLDADDVIAVYASDTNLACSVFGVEIE